MTPQPLRTGVVVDSTLTWTMRGPLIHVDSLSGVCQPGRPFACNAARDDCVVVKAWTITGDRATPRIDDKDIDLYGMKVVGRIHVPICDDCRAAYRAYRDAAPQERAGAR